MVLFPVGLFLIFSKKREIQITMENVSPRQEDVILQVERRFHFDRQRAVAAGSEDGFDGIEQVLIQAGDGTLLGECLG